MVGKIALSSISVGGTVDVIRTVSITGMHSAYSGASALPPLQAAVADAIEHVGVAGCDTQITVA